MPKIESLYKQPVAGMEGFEVKELVVTPESIEGDRSFAVVLETELENLQIGKVPKRMTQNNFPTLSLFQTQEKDGRLIIYFEDESITVNQSLVVEESPKPFWSPDEKFEDNNTLLQERAIPLKVSSTSESKRWGIDCGDRVATWLSEKLGKKVRLIKAVKHPESPKHHFTWYTQLHAVTRASIDALAAEIGMESAHLNIRPNIVIADVEAAYEEESWQGLVLASVEAVVTMCQRCAYVNIDTVLGVMNGYAQVLKKIAQEHGQNFGIYIEPGPNQTFTIRVGDEVVVISRTSDKDLLGQ